jgi:hypothetical protein
LMERTGDGSLTALELTTAFCKRAAFAHQLVWTPPLLSASSSLTA